MDAAGPTVECVPGAGRPELLLQTRQLLDAGLWAEALEILQSLLDEDPDDAPAWNMVAEAFRGLGDRQRCFWASFFSLKADPYDPAGYEWRVSAYLAFGESDNALKTAREGVEMTHGEPPARRTLARALLENNQLPEAEWELQRLHSLLPEDPQVMALSGEALRRRCNEAYALQWIQTALARDPRCEIAYAALGAQHADKGRAQPAAEAYHLAYQLCPMHWAYRAHFLNQVDTASSQEGWGRAVAVMGAVQASLMRAHPGCLLFLLPVAAVGVLFQAPLQRAIALSFTRRRMPHLEASYSKALAEQEAESIPQFPSVWLWTLGIAAAILLAVGWKGGWFDQGAQLVLVTGLAIYWAWERHRGREDADRFEGLFYFPADERPEGKEDPPPKDADLDDFAWWQLASGKPARARALALRVLGEDPENVSVLITFALACLALGEPEEGRTAALAALEEEPDEPRAQAIAWLLTAASGRLPEVLAAGKGDAEAPLIAEPMMIYARALRRARAPEAADLAEELILELAPDSAEAFALTGDAALKQRRPKDADAAYREALARDPESADYTTRLGRVAAAQGRFAEAWTHWNQALRLDPERPAALGLLKGQLRRGVILLAAALAVVAGVIGFWPTLLGRPTNLWMPTAVLIGPVFSSLAALAVQQVLLRRGAPFLREDEDLTPQAAAVDALRASIPTLLVLHSAQAWLELAVHRSQFAAGWSGAATVTFVAAYALSRTLRPLRAALHEGEE